MGYKVIYKNPTMCLYTGEEHMGRGGKTGCTTWSWGSGGSSLAQAVCGPALQSQHSRS